MTIFTSQYLEEFRVPCSAVVLIYLNEEVLLLHSSFSHQQFFFLSIALVLSPHFIFKSLFLARHTFSLLFLCVYVCEGWNNPESALVFPHSVLEPLVNMNLRHQNEVQILRPHKPEIASEWQKSFISIQTYFQKLFRAPFLSTISP